MLVGILRARPLRNDESTGKSTLGIRRPSGAPELSGRGRHPRLVKLTCYDTGGLINHLGRRPPRKSKPTTTRGTVTANRCSHLTEGARTQGFFTSWISGVGVVLTCHLAFS